MSKYDTFEGDTTNITIYNVFAVTDRDIGLKQI